MTEPKTKIEKDEKTDDDAAESQVVGIDVDLMRVTNAGGEERAKLLPGQAYNWGDRFTFDANPVVLPRDKEFTPWKDDKDPWGYWVVSWDGVDITVSGRNGVYLIVGAGRIPVKILMQTRFFKSHGNVLGVCAAKNLEDSVRHKLGVSRVFPGGLSSPQITVEID